MSEYENNDKNFKQEVDGKKEYPVSHPDPVTRT